MNLNLNQFFNLKIDLFKKYYYIFNNEYFNTKHW